MTTTRIGSVFSGIGAMDLAAERHFKACTAWFCERESYAQQVLGKRWPGVPIYEDVTTLADEGAEPVNILIGGPPCVDLSYAGRRAGLTAERSGLFFDFVQVAARMDPQPRWIFIENVPALLSEYRGVVESELASCGAGYGVTWAKVAAAHVPGCPHLRKRVFVLAELGAQHRGVCDAGPIPDISTWPTPTSQDTQRSVEAWLAADAKRRAKGQRQFQSLQIAVRRGHADAPGDQGLWPTPRAQEPGRTTQGYGRGLAELVEGNEQRAPKKQQAAAALTGMWLTSKASDVKAGGYQRDKAGKVWPTFTWVVGARLNPDWVETLQGLPPGWTDIDTDKDPDWLRFYADHLMTMPRWPAPMVKGMWGDSPQHRFEPPRTIAGKQPNRSARLKALGNCLPPQQYLLALQLLEQGPAQATIFDLLGAP